MANRKRRDAYVFGLQAERIAVWYLRFKGYRVLAERYRNHGGEIDVVARKRNMLVAIEVKARSSFSDCEISVTPEKQRRIARAMEGLIAGQGKLRGLADSASYDIRFDTIWIVPWRVPCHIKDAWRM